MATHLVVQPRRVDGSGFLDGTPHRRDSTSSTTRTGEPARSELRRRHRAEQVLLRPLFATSFPPRRSPSRRGLLRGRQRGDLERVEQDRVGHGVLLARRGERELVGLTSPRSVAAVTRMGPVRSRARVRRRHLPVTVPPHGVRRLLGQRAGARRAAPPPRRRPAQGPRHRRDPLGRHGERARPPGTAGDDVLRTGAVQAAQRRVDPGRPGVAPRRGVARAAGAGPRSARAGCASPRARARAIAAAYRDSPRDARKPTRSRAVVQLMPERPLAGVILTLSSEMPLKPTPSACRTALAARGFENAVVDCPTPPLRRRGRGGGGLRGRADREVAAVPRRDAATARSWSWPAGATASTRRASARCSASPRQASAAFRARAHRSPSGACRPSGTAARRWRGGRALFEHQRIWAAAGHPNAVFPLTPAELVAMTGAEVAASAPPEPRLSSARPAATPRADRASVPLFPWSRRSPHRQLLVADQSCRGRGQILTRRHRPRAG